MPFLEDTNETSQTINFFQPVGTLAETVDQQTSNPNEDDAGTTDPSDRVVDEIESLCMNCHENGTTRLLLISIPYFREVILMSFECPHCHFKNAEVQSAGAIQPRGVRYTFRVDKLEDSQRQVVKSDSCTISFPTLKLEIPAQRGQLTTIEGLLNGVLEDLQTDQEARRESDKETYYKIDAFVTNGRKLLEEDGGSFPWELHLDDPSGNSWIEPVPGEVRGKWTRTDYIRSKEQNESLALSSDDQQAPEANATVTAGAGETDAITKDEVYTFPASCPTCERHATTNMKMVDIPHFQEVVIMSTTCENCGYKSNEVKTGGAVPSVGRRITLKVTDAEDLARDILKSETSALSVPEINLDLTPGTLGGRFTTLEGLLSQVYDELHGRIFSETSDSMPPETKARWEKFFEGLSNAKEGKIKFTVVLEDPLAASYLQNLYAPDVDPNMVIEDYERTEEQNEDLGINDMVLEGYGSGNEKEGKEE